MGPLSAFLRPTRRPPSRLREEAGFTLVEMLIASVVFITVATGLAGILTSSIASHSLSRDRSRGEQIGEAMVEMVRKLSFSQVGTPSGNPPGVVPADGNWTSYFSPSPVPDGLRVPAGYTVSIKVSLVNDAAGAWSSVKGNYKKVVVSVTRTRDGRPLAALTTLVAPKNKTEMAGLASVGVNVTVTDYVTNAAVPDATVTISAGPSPSRNDSTDSAGQVSFVGLAATNPSAPGNYYDLAVAKTGYQTYSADLPPATSARFTLAPSETVNKTIRIFKPATIDVALKDASNNPYTGAATVKVYSAKTTAWTTFDVPGGGSGTLPPIDTLGADIVWPNVQYTIRAFTPTGLCAQSSATNVPDNYPSVVTTTFNLQLTTCPSETVNVHVQQLGSDVTGATVQVAGGPNGVSLTGTTDASGNVSFANVPSGTDTYTVTTTRTIGGNTYTATNTITVSSSTVNLNVTLPSPATTSVNVTVTGFGGPVSGAVVSLTGSPFGNTFADVTTTGSGVATFTGVAVGNGYTVTAVKATAAATATVNVSPGPNPVSLPLPSGSVAVTVTQLSAAAAGATLTLSGGPLATTQTAAANASGAATFSNVVAGAGYTVTASRYGQTAASTTFAVTAGATSTVSLTLPNPATATLTVTTTWAAQPVNGATVTVTDGTTTLAGTSDASGVATFALPNGSWTIVSAKNGSSATASQSMSGAAASRTLTLPTGTLTVNATWAGQAAAGATVTVTGGPAAGTYTQTTGATGVATLTVPVPNATYPYTVSVSKNTGTGAVSGVTSLGSSVPVAITPVKVVTLTVLRGGAAWPGNTVTISATGGPNGTANANPAYQVTGTLNGSSQLQLTVPAATGFTYTVKVNRSGCGGRTNANTSSTLSSDLAATALTLNMTGTDCLALP